MVESDLRRGLREAHANLKNGKVREALARLFHLTEKYPENQEVKGEIAVALMVRGMESASQGKIDQAREDFTRSIRFQETAEGHLALARIYQSVGNLDDAFAEYTKALDMNEDLPAIHENLGFYFLEIQDFEQAAKAFGHALTRGATGPEAHIGLWKAYVAMERLDKAHEAILDAIARHPRSEPLLTTAGMSCWLRRDPVGAEEYWRRAAKAQPKTVDPLFHLAGLAAWRGEREESLDWLKKSAELNLKRTRELWKQERDAHRPRFGSYFGDEDFLDVLQ